MEKVRKCAHCKAGFTTPAVVWKKQSFCCAKHRETFERIQAEKEAKQRSAKAARLAHDNHVKQRAKRTHAAKSPRDKVAFSFSW